MSLLISFFQDTVGTTFYSKAAEDLARDCLKANQELRCEAGVFGFSYLEICRAKPNFILHTLLEEQRDLFFTDVDSRLHGPLNFESEVPAFVFTASGAPLGHLHFWPFNEHSITFLSAWASKCQDWIGGDHSALVELCRDWEGPIGDLAPIADQVSYQLSKNDSKIKDKAALHKVGWKSVALQ